MGESQLALVAASPLPPPSPPAPATSLSSGPWEPVSGPPRLAPSILPWPGSYSLSTLAPGGQWEESKVSSYPGRGQHPKAIRSRSFLQTQPHPCSAWWGGLWRSGGTAESQGHGYYWSKTMCQKHPLMDGTGPFGLPGRVAPAFGEEACRLACWCAAGWWAVATYGRGSNCTFCSPFLPQTRTVYILG